MIAFLIVATALVLMEPLTALVHRSVMHGFAMGWHRSHHEPPRGTLEANDLFPVVFSIATIALLSVGVYVGGGAVLVPLGIGITAYGASYLFVHDLVIHRRLAWLPLPAGFLAWHRDAHNVHHLYSRAPYGFLAPVVPSALRARAEAAGVARTDRSGGLSR
ncbi:MAG: sterol desaturase family protein [Actinomycetota bacterium]